MHTITEALIAPELVLGKTFASPPAISPGSGGLARPLLLSLSARHFRSHRSPPAVGELSLVYTMDAVATAAAAAAKDRTGDGRVVSVVDMRGTGLANLDSATSKAVVALAQAAYPERLAATVIFGAPAIFGAVWSLLARLLAPASLGKVFFLNSGEDWSKVPGVDGALIPACLSGGGGGPPAMPIQTFARAVGLGPAGGVVVGLSAGVPAVAGDPMMTGGVGGNNGDKARAGGGFAIPARAV